MRLKELTIHLPVELLDEIREQPETTVTDYIIKACEEKLQRDKSQPSPSAKTSVR